MNRINNDFVAERLERLIIEARNEEGSVRTFIQELATTKVFVLLDRPWDGISIPTHETRLMHVSDGADNNQPMLAVFTSAAKTDGFIAMQDNIFKFCALVDAAWAFLGVSENTGILVNPNATDGQFRISPEFAKQLRNIAEQHLHAKLVPTNLSNS